MNLRTKTGQMFLLALTLCWIPSSAFAAEKVKPTVARASERPLIPSPRAQSAASSKVPFTSAPFPSAPSADSSSFVWNGQGFVPMNTYRGGYGNYAGYGSNDLSAREKRGRVIWNGATSDDDSKSQAIMDSQLRYGAEDPRTVDLMWKTAKGFFDEQKYDLAEPLMKELVVTLESHPKLADRAVLDDARTKLSTLQTERERIASSQKSPYGSARNFGRSFGAAGYPSGYPFQLPSARISSPSVQPYRPASKLPYNSGVRNSSGIWNDPNGATVTFGP